MFTENIKLIPKLDGPALDTMFKNLNKRFANVAKVFGKGIGMAMKAGPLLAIASGIAAKLMNPLEKAEEIVDKILGKSGDLTDNADELGTTPGKLARLEALGEMKGVDNSTMRMLMTKFQTDLAQERIASRQKDYKPGLLSNFTDMDDTAEAFFSFIQSLQKLSPEDRTIAQTTVFGERVRGKASPFFNETNPQALLDQLPSSERFDKAIKMADTMGDKLDIEKTINSSRALVEKAPLISNSMIQGISNAQKQVDLQEKQTLQRFEANQAMYLEIQKILNTADKAFTSFLNDVAPLVIKSLKTLGDLMTEMTPKIQEGYEWVKGEGGKMLNEISTWGGKASAAWEEFKKSPIFRFGGGTKK